MTKQQTGQLIGQLGFGCATIGGLHGYVTPADAEATLAAAWDAGIRYFDVAPLYGAGDGERRLGDFLRGRPRASYRLSTKVGWRVEGGRCVFDYSGDGVRRTVEQSLDRLGVDRLDALFIHDVDPYNHGADQPRVFAQAMSDALPVLRELRRAGTVGEIGVGVNDPAVCLAALTHGDFDAFIIAGRYTLLDQHALDALLPACQAAGVRVISGAPFNTGILAGGTRFGHKSASPEIVERARKIAELCRAFDIPLGAAALQFPVRHSAISHVLPGPRTAEQAHGCADWMRIDIPAVFWEALTRRGLVSSGVAALEPAGVAAAAKVPA